MTVFTRLLVPLDGSNLAESALPAALEIGRRLRAQAVLYHALERAAPEMVHGERHLTTQEEVERYLSEVRAWCEQQGIAAMTRSDSDAGEVGPRIAAAAAREEADLVVLCRHGSGGLRGLLFGRVAQQVLQRGRIPVLLVPPSSAGRAQAFQCRRLLVPLDGSQTAETALSAAAALASGFEADIILAMVVPTIETISGERAAATRLMPTAAAALLDAEAAEGRDYLHALAGGPAVRGLRIHAVVGRGEAVRALLDVASAQDADLVVMATHGRSGVGAVWAGSVAQRIIAQSTCPILLVRIQPGGME